MQINRFRPTALRILSESRGDVEGGSLGVGKGTLALLQVTHPEQMTVTLVSLEQDVRYAREEYSRNTHS